MKQQTTTRLRDLASFARSSALPFTTLCVLLAAAMGGGSRPDVLSLILLRPLSMFLLAFALVCYGARAWAQTRGILVIAMAIATLAVFHVLPLPPGLWSLLPGRDYLVSIYHELGSPLPWAPLSLAPTAAWNALFALALPAAVLIGALSLEAKDQRRIAILVIGLCVMTGLTSLLQIAGGSGSSLYFYRITNEGAAVGLFANRNHNALYMAFAFPILAIFWHSPLTQASLQLVRALTVATVIFLLPMIVLTGSRGGLLVVMVGLGGAALIILRGRTYAAPVAQPRRGQAKLSRTRVAVIVALCCAVLATIMLLLVKSSALDRLLEADPSQELRLLALPAIWSQVREYWPWGAGAGTFEFAYRQAEDLQLLSPQYLNHAHNDWLEIILTHGLPGVIILGAVTSAYLVRLAKLFGSLRVRMDRQTALAWSGATIIAMVALLSVFDYPLRVPSVASVFVLAVVWMARRRTSP